MDNNWLSMIKKATKKCIILQNVKRVHFIFENGDEMVDEYNMDTLILTRREWKIKNELRGQARWDTEIGEPNPFNTQGGYQLVTAVNEPVVRRRVTENMLEWRIYKLSCPIHAISVLADPKNKCITVSTKSKKYFKTLPIPELERVNILPKQDQLSFTHRFDTLIISYKKPKELLQLDKGVLEEIQKLQPARRTSAEDCNPS